MGTQHMARMIIFDDDLGQFGPMTDLRAAFEIRTGMLTTAARIVARWPKTLVGYWVPTRLADLVATRANAPVNALPDEEVLFCVNGRWAIPDVGHDLSIGDALLEGPTGHVVAAVLRRADAEYFLSTGHLHERVHIRQLPERHLLKYPWDVIALAKETIPHDLETVHLIETRIPTSTSAVIGEHPVEVHISADVGPNVVFDSGLGPIVIHEGAVVRPNCVICGPCSVGPRSTVVDRAHLKPHTVIGPVCKVGGEVGATIFQGFSNKSHDGHLGDSWVGKWVNFGAGTTNSNLLNTYGKVTMRTEPDGPRHRTDLNFLGSVVGDHVKTAIGTRLMTGSTLGTGAMIACTLAPPDAVRRFAWLTDAGERVYRWEKFVIVMTAMMQRRDQEPPTAYLAVLKSLHDQITAADRAASAQG